MLKVSIPCARCSKPVGVGDQFCESCGEKVDEDTKRALRERLEASDYRARESGQHARTAANTIAVVAVLFVIGGIVFYFWTRSQADDALTSIAGLDASQPLVEPVQGARNVGELREAIEREPWQVLGLNLFLALVMAGLFWWSRRALLPAVIAALAIYVAVLLASALYNPMTLAQGVLVKIIIIVVLARGVKAALNARALGIA